MKPKDESKQKGITSVSLELYIILALSALAVILIFALLDPYPQEKLSVALSNIAYGVFGSTVVAALVDFAAMKRQIENDKKKFDIYSKYFKRSIEQMLYFRTSYGGNSDVNYIDWMLGLYDNEGVRAIYGDQECTMKIAFDGMLKTLYLSADKLNDYSYILVGSKYVEDEYFRTLNVLIKRLERCLTAELNTEEGKASFRNDFEKAAEYFDTILKTSEYKGYFTEQWDPEKMSGLYKPVDWIFFRK